VSWNRNQSTPETTNSARKSMLHSESHTSGFGIAARGGLFFGVHIPFPNNGNNSLGHANPDSQGERGFLGGFFFEDGPFPKMPLLTPSPFPEPPAAVPPADLPVPTQELGPETLAHGPSQSPRNGEKATNNQINSRYKS